MAGSQVGERPIGTGRDPIADGGDDEDGFAPQCWWFGQGVFCCADEKEPDLR